MTRRTRTLTFLALLSSHCALPLIGWAPVPRDSPELKFTDTSGKQRLLSSFKGKVVLVEFLLTACPHCARVAQTIDRLNRDLGPRGLQPIGIALEDGPSGPTLTDFARNFNITFLAGYTSSEKVDAYIGREPMQRFQVPQIVVIDRNGVIRAQSQSTGETALEDESHLRSLLQTLLEDGSPSWISRAPGFSLALAVVLGGTLIWTRRRKWQKSLTSPRRVVH